MRGQRSTNLRASTIFPNRGLRRLSLPDDDWARLMKLKPMLTGYAMSIWRTYKAGRKVDRHDDAEEIAWLAILEIGSGSKLPSGGSYALIGRLKRIVAARIKREANTKILTETFLNASSLDETGHDGGGWQKKQQLTMPEQENHCDAQAMLYKLRNIPARLRDIILDMTDGHSPIDIAVRLDVTPADALHLIHCARAAMTYDLIDDR